MKITAAPLYAMQTNMRLDSRECKLIMRRARGVAGH
jgi:hypothetical protein